MIKNKKVIKYKTEDLYEQIHEWCRGNSFPEVTLGLLPPTTFVCFNHNDEPIYSICYYNTDSNIAWLGWELGNPNVKHKDKIGGLDFLIEEVSKYSKESGYRFIQTISGTKSVINSLLNNNFIVADENINQYFKIL